jgi:glutathione peroxidase-family protein
MSQQVDSPFHTLNMTSITGEAVDFASYAGKLCLVVNVASR